MQKPCTILAISSLLSLIAGCSSPAAEPLREIAPFDPASVKTVLDAQNKVYDERFRDSTPAYFAARYTKDACVMAPRMPRICGLDGIVKYYWSGGENQTLTLDMRGEEVNGTPEEVYEVGSYRVLDDEGTEMDKGKFIAIYRNQEGRWKVHREIWNSDLSWDDPAQEAPAPN